MKFRLPRKIKKYLKKQALLYPPDKDGSSLMANPKNSQEEYDLYKKGHFRDLIKISKKDREAFRLKIFSEVEMTDEKLKEAIDYIFAKTYRAESYRILLKAKNHNNAKHDYYAFINAYNLTVSGDDHGNTCCSAVDFAKLNMK